MRSIATRLGVGTMSLYRYVPGKGELLDLMLDHVIDVPEEGEEEGEDGRSWREILTADARHHRRYINERRAEARTGVSNEEFWQAQAPTLVAALTSGRYPTMAALSPTTPSTSRSSSSSTSA